MDTVLARSFSLQPENKIAMRHPSWPDTPLHQYFGAKKSNRKNLDFVLSSLGYIRLYQYCCPCEKSYDLPIQESGFESSFVHLEERMRSDGPFTLYRRPQRHLGLGLTERAREKRLLRYYKYFQGFQRKLQVSRQFQQNVNCQKEKSNVKKVMKCYKPKKKSLPEASASNVKGKKKSQPAATTELRDQSTKQNDEMSKENQHSKAQANTDNILSNIGKTTKEQDLIVPDSFEMLKVPENNTMSESVDTNANKYTKRRQRATIIVPTLEPIEETLDCEVSESEANVVRINSSLLPAASCSATRKQYGECATQQKSSSGNDKPMGLRGILKYPKQKNDYMGPEYGATAGTSKSTIFASTDLQTKQEQYPIKTNLRKLSSAKKTSSRSEMLDASLSFDDQATMSKEATLRKVMSQKVLRFRSRLQRSNTSIGGQSNDFTDEKEAPVIDVEPEDGVEAISPQAVPSVSGSVPLDIPQIPIKQVPSKRANFVDFVDPEEKITSIPMRKKSIFKSKKGSSDMNSIRFQGWDYNAPIGRRRLKTLPDDKDVSDYILKRIEKVNRSFDEEEFADEYLKPLPPHTSVAGEDPKEYLQENDILQIFEHFTIKLVQEQPYVPLDLLDYYAHDLSVQHDQMVNIQDDMRNTKENPVPREPCPNTDSLINSIKMKAMAKRKYRIDTPVQGRNSPVTTKLENVEIIEPSETIIANESNIEISKANVHETVDKSESKLSIDENNKPPKSRRGSKQKSSKEHVSKSQERRESHESQKLGIENQKSSNEHKKKARKNSDSKRKKSSEMKSRDNTESLSNHGSLTSTDRWSDEDSQVGGELDNASNLSFNEGPVDEQPEGEENPEKEL